jgi:YD repeat-containing protein
MNSNANSRCSLVQQGSNYVYTAKDQTVYNFSSGGQLTSAVDPSGLTTSYTYTSGLLTGVTAPDGGSTVLRYDTHNFLYQVTEAGRRNFNLTQTEVQVGSGWQSTLTQITDVDNTTRTLGYNSLHHLTSDRYAPEYSSFSYDSNTALLNGVTLGQSTTQPYTIASAASFNLTGTSTLSAVPGVVGTALPTPAATVTDGNNHTTQYLLDMRGPGLGERHLGRCPRAGVANHGPEWGRGPVPVLRRRQLAGRDECPRRWNNLHAL